MTLEVSRNIKLIVEYDGTAFCGWQRQRDTRTVQGVIEDAVERVFGCRADVHGAGRTDTGVHAIDYPCNFHVVTDLGAPRIAKAISAHLPDDVVVKSAVDVPDAFHARFDAVSRRYLYRVGTAPTSLWRAVRYTPRFTVDPGRMTRAAQFLVGEHDFTSFTPSINQAEPVCKITEASVAAEGDEIRIVVEGNRFLHHMVRVIAGTLLEVGRGRIEPERVEAILCKRDRRAAGPTAPPHGLALVSVRFPDDAG